ncbi:MAG: SDR family oxidoreductase [SAR202 cluster bacterium]|nr:SDR family oxidoreductase [SAR202 cluster bacterium]
MPEIAKRVALITGATGGLGKHVLATFEGAAWEVAREREGDPTSSLNWFDVTDARKVGAAVDGVIKSYGRIDALINLVGTWKPQPSFAETSEDLWDELARTNLRSAFLMCRAVVPVMVGQKWGRIINVGARAAERGTARNAAYSAAKAGVVALTQSLAAELCGTGVTANIVLPSTIDTPGNRAGMPKADFSKWVPPGHIAATMLFLCSDSASSINGEKIRIYNQA